jgi:hypothetical protein
MPKNKHKRTSKPALKQTGLHPALPIAVSAIFLMAAGVWFTSQLLQKVNPGFATNPTIAFDDYGRSDWCSSTLRNSLNSSVYLDVLGSGSVNYLNAAWNNCNNASIGLITAELWNANKDLYAQALGNGRFLPEGVTRAWTTTAQADKVYTINSQTGATSLAANPATYTYDALPIVKLNSATACAVSGTGSSSDPYVLGDPALCAATEPVCNISRCTACSSDNVCSACAGGYYLSNNQCLPASPTPSCNINHCSACSGDNICAACQNGYALSGNTCVVSNPACNVSHCSACSSANVCASCSVGYYPGSSNQCLPECNVDHCQSCSLPNTCGSCSSGYGLDGGQCVRLATPTPTPTADPAPAPDVNCNVNYCQNCLSPNVCAACASGYILQNGRCVRSTTSASTPAPTPTLSPAPASPDATSSGTTATGKKDTDGDGYPDEWEAEHGYDPLDPNSHPPANDATDTDKDGISDRQELAAGSDPTDAKSTPANLSGTNGSGATGIGTGITSSLASLGEAVSGSPLGRHVAFVPDVYSLVTAAGEALGLSGTATTVAASIAVFTQSGVPQLFSLLCLPLALLAFFFPLKRGLLAGGAAASDSAPGHSSAAIAGALIVITKEQQFVAARLSDRFGSFAGFKLPAGQYQGYVSHPDYLFQRLPLIKHRDGPGEVLTFTAVGWPAGQKLTELATVKPQPFDQFVFKAANLLSQSWPLLLTLGLILACLYATWLNVLALLAFAPALYRKAQSNRKTANLTGTATLDGQPAANVALECYQTQTEALALTTATDAHGVFHGFLAPKTGYYLQAPHFYLIQPGGAVTARLNVTGPASGVSVKLSAKPEAEA